MKSVEPSDRDKGSDSRSRSMLIRRLLAPLIEFAARPINGFTLLILIGFAIILFWIGQARMQDFIQAQKSEADNATQTAGAAVEQLIDDKLRLVRVFLEDNDERIATLSLQPDNEALKEDIERKLARYFSDFFSVNIATSEGIPIIDDFDGTLGEVCVADMQAYAREGQRIIRVHPNFHLYHFDIVISFQIDDQERLFFVSFSLDDITRLLWLSRPDEHELMLVQRGEDYLIEVVETGGRNTIPDRIDFRMTDGEKRRILSQLPVNNTRWQIVALHEEGVLSGYRKALLEEGLIIYALFTLALLIIRSFLAREERRRARAEKQLVQRNMEFERLNVDLINANRKLTTASMTDGLTGLNNRRHFDQRLDEELKRARRSNAPVSLMLIDVDYFKSYNDRYGHRAGDECLIRVADVMRDTFKRATDFVARYGGEEFAVIMAGCDRAHAFAAAKKFKHALEQAAIRHEGSRVHSFVTVSGGLCSLVPDGNDTPGKIINEADRALYLAKSEGRNRIK